MGAVAHICNSLQGLQRTGRLEKNEVTMRVGNGATIFAQAIDIYTLHLPSELTIELDNCYYVPAICKNIMYGSCLIHDDFSFKSENNGCSIYLKNMFYGFASMKNGLFYLDLDCSNAVLNISSKRLKKDENTTYMWHCRLGHVGKKRMQKLHKDGILQTFDF